MEIDADGFVTLHGRIIGKVERRSRTYSPPMSKGSRIVKYRKQIPEWHGWKFGSAVYMRPDYRSDTRQRVLQQMVRDDSEANPS